MKETLFSNNTNSTIRRVPSFEWPHLWFLSEREGFEIFLIFLSMLSTAVNGVNELNLLNLLYFFILFSLTVSLPCFSVQIKHKNDKNMKYVQQQP